MQNHDALPRDAVTPVRVRAALESLLERDLLGPWDGPEEELEAGSSPAERYLLGRLVPRSPDVGADEAADDTEFASTEMVDREVSVDGEDGDDVEPEATARFGSMAASSLGLSFTVPDDVDVVAVEAAWGRYARAAADSQETPTGQDGVVVAFQVRHRSSDGGQVRMVHVALVNDQPRSTGTPDMARLYQAGLTVTALDGVSAVFVGHNDPQLSAPPPVPGTAASMPGLVLDMNRLGNPELAADDLVAGLRPLVSGYRSWLATQQVRLDTDAEIARYAPAG